MEEVFLPGIVLDEPEPFINSQCANLACHVSPPAPVVTTDGASGDTPSGASHRRLVPSSFKCRHAGPQPRVFSGAGRGRGFHRGAQRTRRRSASPTGAILRRSLVAPSLWRSVP